MDVVLFESEQAFVRLTQVGIQRFRSGRQFLWALFRFTELGAKIIVTFIAFLFFVISYEEELMRLHTFDPHETIWLAPSNFKLASFS